MDDRLRRHVRRLRLAVGLAIGGIVVVAAAANLPAPDGFRLTQADALLWVVVGVAVLNLVTVMPTYRAMLAGPKRVFEVDGEATALLQSQKLAHTVATARIAGIAALGLLQYLVTGERIWVWSFASVAMVGCLLLWPRAAKVRALVGARSRP